MRIWIDTEFNSFRGALISLACVAENGEHLYFVLPYAHMNLNPWVRRHVIPLLCAEPVEADEARAMLVQYLAQFETVHIVADWPEDIAHFCMFLITGPGQRLDTPPLTMEVLRDLDDVPSATPHNALADARAIRESHLAKGV